MDEHNFGFFSPAEFRSGSASNRDAATSNRERERTIEGPGVSQAQFLMQEEFLRIQSQVLQTSILISNIVQKVTREAFRVSDEAKLALGLIAATVLKAAESIQNSTDPNIQQCTNKLEIPDDLFTMKTRMLLKIFSCTHTLSHQAMQIEKRMTTLINSVRAHIIQAMDAMWLCEPEEVKVGNEWARVIDESCLTALKQEGEEITNVLPNKSNSLLEEVKRLEVSSASILQKCVVETTSAASDKATYILHQIRNCSTQSTLTKDQQEFNMAKYIQI